MMLVPQGMAYALLAGLPPIAGLYASTVPMVVYAFFGSSRHLSVGPAAIVSLLTFTGLSAIAEPESGEYLGLALLLALMAGAMQLGLGLLRGATLLIGVEEGLMLGVLFALLAFVHRSARPQITELGYSRENDAFLDVRRRGVVTHPRVLIARFEAPLYFANANYLSQWISARIKERPETRYVVVSCRAVSDIDATAIGTLESMVFACRERGMEILFSGMNPSVREKIERAGWPTRLGDMARFATTREALESLALLKEMRHPPSKRTDS
ncbi:STAS domain-containing protein [Rubrobacter taiwanensis]|uniref:STAS domain-containing protein n=2 Tax=Rubrobacter taiwanensis TaxID=185139 RepID=A0A4R1BI94_9ACTN|nr:STAS domain-containing protein [Rubrobacter taiwanensis]